MHEPDKSCVQGIDPCESIFSAYTRVHKVRNLTKNLPPEGELCWSLIKVVSRSLRV